MGSNELAGPFLLDSDIGINSSWGVSEDCRDNGAAFDGNVDTITEFADLPQKGQYIIYELAHFPDKGTSTRIRRRGPGHGCSGRAFHNNRGDKARRSRGRQRYRPAVSAACRSPHRGSHNIWA